MRVLALGLKPSQMWGLGAVLLLLLAVACGAAATATPLASTSVPAPGAGTPTAVPQAAPTAPAVTVHPGKLTIMLGALGNERFDYGFQVGGGGSTQNYGRILNGFLVSINERTEMIPGIASQWGLSADGLTWSFTVRKGVKFHDGSELTPQDVAWSLEHQFGPQAYEYVVPTPARTSRAMSSIQLSGPGQVSLITKQPVPELAILLSEASNEWYSLMPKRATLHDTAAEEAYDYNPNATGSMKLTKHVQAAVMEFERFEDFYYQPKNGFPEDKRVNFRTLHLFLAPEEATRVAALRAGEADIVPASLATKKQVEAGGGRIVYGPEGVWVDAFLPGCYKPQYPCHDKRVRQALDYAIDKALLRDRLYGGSEVFQVKGWNVITPSTIGYTPAMDPTPFNPAKARQLLAEAGYPGGQGFGKLFIYTKPSTAMPLQVEAAQLAAEFWKKELGLDVEVTVLDSVSLTKRAQALELDGQVIWRDNEARTDGSGNLTAYYGDPKDYRHFHEDPEMFRAVQETLRILDPEKRAAATRELLPRLKEEGYRIGVGYVNIPWGVGPRVAAWRPYSLSVWPSALHTVVLK